MDSASQRQFQQTLFNWLNLTSILSALFIVAASVYLMLLCTHRMHNVLLSSMLLCFVIGIYSQLYICQFVRSGVNMSSLPSFLNKFKRRGNETVS